ncbi:glycerophosphodiester phosphodiesterase [Bacillus sp. DJP31]|uniref:glycerophosphodiester phosphodiesterase n=1 Tax=Bacillus sp. DJP31 TaxID=3409789 RepID=UPI003BB5707E
MVIIRTFLLIFLALSLFIVLSGVTFQGKSYKVDITKNTLLIAHRGASALAPENTVAAFDKAITMKADYIEIDVQMSKDGELVIIHDVTVDRTTNGKGMVKDFTYEELAKLDAGIWYSERFAGERIPTLSIVLDRYEGKIGILIELKEPSLYPGITQQLASVLTKRVIVNSTNAPILVQSFDHQAIQELHTLLPSIPKGIIISDTTGLSKKKIQEIDEYATFVCIYKHAVDFQFMKLAKQMDWQVFTWTVSSREMVIYLQQLNVDGIVTDHPGTDFQRIY